jgi:hypothetical protein
MQSGVYGRFRRKEGSGPQKLQRMPSSILQRECIIKIPRRIDMYLQLKDKDGYLSPILRIHQDSEEFLAEVHKWRDGLFRWIEEDERRKGMPLGRLEPGTCMIDLLRHLTEYYKETTPNCGGRVWATLKLLECKDYNEWQTAEDIIEIKLY